MWYDKEADDTYLIIGGAVLFLIISIGLFILHGIHDGDLLSPEIIMALVTSPITVISYGVGKKHGMQAHNGNGNGNSAKDPDSDDPYKPPAVKNDPDPDVESLREDLDKVIKYLKEDDE